MSNRTQRTLSVCASAVIAMAPHVAHAAIHNSPFGLSELHTTSNNSDSVQTNPLAAGWTWHHVYPLAKDSKGKDWRLNTDNEILVTQAVGLDLTLTLWTAKTYNGKSYYPADTTAWKDSVKAVVERYDGDGYQDYNKLITPVKYWHVEEELSWWGSTWTQYSQYLGLTRRAILAADPTAKVICAGLDSNQLWGCGYRSGFIKMPASSTLNYSSSSLDRYEAKIDTVLKGGFYDIVDMHSYEQESILAGKCAFVRSHMYNPSLPIWAIEASGPYLSRAQGYTDTLNAQMVVRQFAEAFGVGMPRYTYILYQYPANSMWNTEPWINMSLTSGTTSYTFKPAYYTYQQMTQVLGGFSSAADLTARTSTEDRDIFCIRFVKSGQPIDVYWCDHDTTLVAPVTLAYAQVTHIITVAGQNVTNARVEFLPASLGGVTLKVGRDPVYVQSVAAAGKSNALTTSASGGDAHEAHATRPPSSMQIARLQASPTPAREQVTFRLSDGTTAWSGEVRLSICSAAGRAVRILHAGAADMPAGVRWDTRNNAGQPAAPGVYWVDARDLRGHQARTRLLLVR